MTTADGDTADPDTTTSTTTDATTPGGPQTRSSFDDLLASIGDQPVLGPEALALAIVDGERSGRLTELRDALTTRPAPRVPPRYESEIRTWLARTGLATDAAASRLQAYAAVHLDPHNVDALAALDAAAAACGDDVRRNTWAAVVNSYPDVQSVRNAAADAGVELPDPDLQRQAQQALRAARGRQRPGAPKAKDAKADGTKTDSTKGDGTKGAKGDKGPKGDKARRRPRAVGIGTLVPAFEPDPVKEDRLAAVLLASDVTWGADAAAATHGDDVLSWAKRRLAAPAGVEPTDDDARIAEAAPATAQMVALLRGEPDRDGDVRTGPRVAKLCKRTRNHPAVVCWAARLQLDDGDATGAARTLDRLDDPVPTPYATEAAALRRLLDLAGADPEAGWQAFVGGELPPALREPLARALLSAGRDAQADEVLGLPEVPAGDVDDPRLLALRFDVLFADADADGALVQARRLVDCTPDSASAIGRLWLGLAGTGRFEELAERAGTDVARAATDVADVVRSVRPELEARTHLLLGDVRDRVASVRRELQTLSKGRTIRDDAFGSLAQTAADRLAELSGVVDLVRPPEPGDYPASDEGLLAVLASGFGRHLQLVGDRVRIAVDEAAERVADDPVVAALAAPARELADRRDLLEDLVTAARSDLDAARAEAQRTDVARRRLEERVSRRARRAADAVGALLHGLDPFRPAPPPPVVDEPLDEPVDEITDGAAGEPADGADDTALAADLVDAVTEPSDTAAVADDVVVEDETPELGDTGDVDDTDASARTGRWFRFRRGG